MTFLVSAALAVAFLVVGPLVAHLLRRGRARRVDFPPARLVPGARSAARQRSRIEDRWLFAVRATTIGLLALLGATPLARCSQLSLSRNAGASVALAIVLDDSLSMRARLPSGETRWERAKRGALELVGSARHGDALAIVLAGQPARVTLAPTTDLARARRVLDKLEVGDRATDLADAVLLARSVLKDLVQRDKQLAVLSDLAAEPPPDGKPPLWAPLEDLTVSLENCGVASAVKRGREIEAKVACSSAAAAEGRLLVASSADTLSGEPEGKDQGSAALALRGGLQTVSIDLGAGHEPRGVRLSGKDALARDDAASVGQGALSLGVAVHADPARASASTGGPTLIEQGLEALAAGTTVRPFAVLPEDPKELASVAVLVLDDPAGIGPEERSALDDWIARGGVALALLGPRAERVQLGSTLEPFARGAVRWQTTTVAGLDAASLAWLGPEAQGLGKLAPRGRCLIESTDPGARIAGRWSDGAPFLLEREQGRGVVVSAGLPSAPGQSDFALRPGFLALLDHVLGLAAERLGLRAGLPGVPWRFPEDSRAEVKGPAGLLAADPAATESGKPQRIFTPELAGRYRITTKEGSEERVVTLDAEEISSRPRQAIAAGPNARGPEQARHVDVSREVVYFLLVLVGLEALLRGAHLVAARRRNVPAPSDSPTASIG